MLLVFKTVIFSIYFLFIKAFLRIQANLWKCFEILSTKQLRLHFLAHRLGVLHGYAFAVLLIFSQFDQLTNIWKNQCLFILNNMLYISMVKLTEFLFSLSMLSALIKVGQCFKEQARS